MKKILTVALAGVMAAGTALAFTGCTDDGYSREGRLAVWVGEQFEEMFQTIAEDYEAETGMPVVVKTYTGLTASDKLAMDGPAGRGGDIYMQGGGGDLASAVEQGLFIEIDPDEVEYTTKYIESGQELMMYNGKVYGVPLGTEVEVLYYNRDIVSDDIVSSWTSWEDMMAWAKTYNHFGQGISTRDEQFGLLIDYSNPYYTWCINEAFGGYIFGTDEDGNYDPYDLGIDNAGSQAAYAFIKSMIDDGVIAPDLNNSVAMSKFMNGKAAIVLDGSWNLSNYRNAGIDVGVLKLPDINAAKEAGGTGTPRVFSGGYGLAVSAYSVNKEESVDFLKFATRDEYVIEYYRISGRIPSTVGASQNEEVLADDCIAGFYEQAEDSFIQPPINELNAVWDPLTSAAVAIFTNGQDIATVLSSVKQSILDNYEIFSPGN